MFELKKEISHGNKFSDKQVNFDSYSILHFELEGNQLNKFSEKGIFDEFININFDSYFNDMIFYEIFPFYPEKCNSDESEDYADDSLIKNKINSNLLNKEKEGYNIEKVCSFGEILKRIWDIIPEKIKNNLKKEALDYIAKKDKKSVALFKTANKKQKKLNSFSKKKKVLGRKRKGDNSERIHTKNNQDNIIKKCKAIFFSNLISYINKYVQKYSNHNKNFKLLTLDYKYVNNITKEDEMKLLATQLKDLASFETSKIYKLNKNKFINKIKIENILEEEKNNEKINKLLNMTFGEWIDIFTLKKNLEYEFRYEGLKISLEKIANNSNTEYFVRFLYFLFNYKRWFISKVGRVRRKREN